MVKARFFDTSITKKNVRDFVDYLDREEACDMTSVDPFPVQMKLNYIDNRKGSTGLFSSNGDIKSENCRQNIDKVYKQKGIVWDYVLSFRSFEYLNDKKIRGKKE